MVVCFELRLLRISQFVFQTSTAFLNDDTLLPFSLSRSTNCVPNFSRNGCELFWPDYALRSHFLADWLFSHPRFHRLSKESAFRRFPIFLVERTLPLFETMRWLEHFKFIFCGSQRPTKKPIFIHFLHIIYGVHALMGIASSSCPDSVFLKTSWDGK